MSDVATKLAELGYAPDEIGDIKRAINRADVASFKEIFTGESETPNTAGFCLRQIIDRLYAYAASDK